MIRIAIVDIRLFKPDPTTSLTPAKQLALHIGGELAMANFRFHPFDPTDPAADPILLGPWHMEPLHDGRFRYHQKVTPAPAQPRKPAAR